MATVVRADTAALSLAGLRRRRRANPIAWLGGQTGRLAHDLRVRNLVAEDGAGLADMGYCGDRSVTGCTQLTITLHGPIDARLVPFGKLPPVRQVSTSHVTTRTHIRLGWHRGFGAPAGIFAHRHGNNFIHRHDLIICHHAVRRSPTAGPAHSAGSLAASP